MNFTVDESVFEKNPKLVIGLVVANGLDNTKTNEAVNALFTAEVERQRRTWKAQPSSPCPNLPSIRTR